ncbi:MAG: hypothetical protein ACRD2W_12370 [Acidimicrobiales bacterium]
MARNDQAAKPGTPAGVDEVDFSWLTDRVRRFSEKSRLWGRLRPGPEKEGWTGLTGALIVALLLGLWMTAGAWGDRPPSGEDTLAHLARAQFALRELLPHGRIDGWHPGFIVGYQEFLFTGPGFTWAVGLVRVLSLGLLSVPGAFKVVFIGSLVVLPLAVAFFARSFGLSRRAAGIAGILTLAVNNPFGVGIQGLFNVGLVIHQFGAIFFFLTLGGVLRLLEQPRIRWIVLSGAAGAALLVSHGISVILLAPLLGILLLVHVVPTPSEELRKKRFEVLVRREVQAELRRLGAAPAEGTAEGEGAVEGPDVPEMPATPKARIDWRPLIMAGLLSAALAACTLLPFVAHRDLRGGFTGWGTPTFGDRVSQIRNGDIMFRPGVVWLVLAGLVYGLYRVYQGQRYALAMVSAPVIYLIVSHASLNLWPSSVVSNQLPNRGVGYVGILAMLPLAALVDRVVGARAAGSVVAVLVAAAVVVLPIGPIKDMPRQSGDPVPAMEEAARQVRRLVPDGARFLTERDFPREIERTGLINPDRWLAWASGRNTLNNFNVESSTAGEPAFEAEHIRDRPADAVGASLSKLGVSHLVTLSDEASAQMDGSARFRRLWSQAPVVIYEVLPAEGQPGPAALLTANVPVTARLTKGEAEAVDISFSASAPGLAQVAIAWSPKWHARLDGQSVPLSRGVGSLLEVVMPAGDHRLELRFRPDAWDRIGLVVSLATALGGSLWLFRRRRPRPSTSEG